MKKGGGKSKGTAFEREMCKTLSLWVTAGKRDDVLWRSSISGGRATVAARKGKNLHHVSGDICAVHPDGAPLIEAFFIEAKCYGDLMLSRLLVNQTGRLADFWKIAKREARRYNKMPMLVWKQSMFDVFVCLDERGYRSLQLQRANVSLPDIEMIGVTLQRLVKTPFALIVEQQQPKRARMGLGNAP